MSDDAKPESDPAKDWLAETFPQPEQWPEPRPADRTAPEVQPPKHSRLGDGLRGAATLAAGLYVHDALTDDDSAEDTSYDMGSGGDAGSS